MANVGKKDGGQQQGSQVQGTQVQGTQVQGTQVQGPQTQGQRGELVRRDPFQAMVRDPFHLMRELMVDPFRMLQMSPWGLFGRDLGWNPGFEVRETDDALVFKADVPGIHEADLDISLSGNQLQISGKREHEQEQGEGEFHTYERSYGSFLRSFSLPESADLDKIRTELKDGVLTLVVPKKPGSVSQRRKIQIGSGSKS